MKITDSSIKKLSKPDSGNTIHYDDELMGFGVRVTAAGQKSYVLNYRIFGRHRRYTIGRCTEMSAEIARNGIVKGDKVEFRGAQQLLQLIRSGVDPMEERRELQQAESVNDLVDAYFNDAETLKLRPSTLRDYKRMAEKIIRPNLGTRRLKAINRSDIAALHASFKESAPYQGNRMLALISAMYSFAMQDGRGWVDKNPALRKGKKNPDGIRHHDEVKRKRYLKPAEVDRFYKALDAYVVEHNDTRYRQTALDSVNALKLLLLTGSRLNEVLQAEWREFDLDRGVWVKPADKVKGGEEIEIPLADVALEVLASMKPIDSGPLFPGRDGKKARVSLKRVWDYVIEHAKLINIRKHDIRHSFASFAISNGVPLAVVGALLGHKQVSTTARYTHILDSPKREGANVVGRVLKFPRKSA